MAITWTEGADSRQNLGMSGIIQQNRATFAANDYPSGGYPVLPAAFGLSHIHGMWPDAFTTGTAPYEWRYIRPAVNGNSSNNPGFIKVFQPSGSLSPATTPSAVTTELGSAANYAVLAYSGITNSGATVISGGNIGSYPTASITGFPPGVLIAPAVIDNTDAQAAQVALAAAITYYEGLTPTLSGLSTLSTAGNGSTASTFIAGNYFGTALTMATGITLDGQGNPNAQFVFVSTSTINLATGQSVTLINGAQASNVVFVCGSAFTAVAPSTMVGNILTVSGVTLGGGTLMGRAMSTTGPVTISAATTISSPSGSTPSGGPPVEVPAGTNFGAGAVDFLAFGF